MTPVKVPTVPCADAAPGQETAAINATAAKDGFDMLNLPRSLDDQPATESVDRVLYLELGRNSHYARRNASTTKPSRAPAAAPFSGYLKRNSKARECRNPRSAMRCWMMLLRWAGWDFPPIF